MITLKEIEISKHVEPEFTTMRAQIKKSRVCRIHPEELRSEDDIEKRLRVEVWRDLYGEYSTPINELLAYVRSKSEGYEQPRIDDLRKRLEPLLVPSE